MKKYIAILSLFCFLIPFCVSCTSDAIQGDVSDTETSFVNTTAGTELNPAPQESEVPADSIHNSQPEDQNSPVVSEKERGSEIVLLTKPYFDGYELTEELDYEAFLDYLELYFEEIIGEDAMVVITDMIDNGGVVTLLTEYHDIKAVEAGRRSCTIRGGGNLFFNYSTESGADFSESLFAGVQRLHNFYNPEPFIDGDYVFIDMDGYVCIHQHDGKILKTPAKYEWDCFMLEDSVSYLCDDNHMSGKQREHYIVAVYTKTVEDENITERSMMVYTTKDGGVTWSESELDYTPVTTEFMFPVTDISMRSLNMGELDTCSIILGTNRCEVFYFVTDDGGITWERRRNFKLLNYQNSAFIDGGIIFDDLALMSFEARNGKNPNVYISRDGGYNWELMDIPAPDGLSDEGAHAVSMWKWNGAVMIDVAYGDEICSYVSFDRGDTWEWQN